MTIFAGNATRTDPQAASKPTGAGRGRRADGRRLRPAAELLEGRRLMASGAVDPTFGMAGFVNTEFDLGPDGVMRPVAVAVQADGRIVVAGSVARGQSGFSGPADFAVVRLDVDGGRDATFGGGDGAVTIDLNRGPTSSDRPSALAIQADGKIVVGGTASAVDRDDLALVRLNTDGSPDAGFGTAGRAFAFPPGVQINGGLTPDPTLESLAFQPDGRIVITGGTTDSQFGEPNRQDYLARFTTEGRLDPTFSGDGFREVGEANLIGQSRVIVQADGRIVRGFRFSSVNNRTDGTGPGFEFERYLADGSIDPSFGVGGRASVTFAFGNGPSPTVRVVHNLEDLILQPDGKIVAAGTIQAFDSAPSFERPPSAFAAVRLDRDGALDATFDGDGRVILTFNEQGDFNSEAYTVAIQPDGKLLLAGSVRPRVPDPNIITIEAPSDVAVVRLNSDGSLDRTFADRGTAIVASFPGNSAALEVATQPGGQIIVFGVTFLESSTSALVRLNGNNPLPPLPSPPPPLPIPSPGPMVVSATPVRRRFRTSAVVVRFDTDLNPASANAAGNYALSAVGRPRRRGRPTPLRPLAIAGVSYDAATRSATLTPARPPLRNVRLRLVIAGANVFGANGVRLAGSGGIGTDLIVPVS